MLSVYLVVESGMTCAYYQVSLTNVIETREIGKLQMLSLCN